MKEEGLLYDPKSHRFLHVRRHNGHLMIDEQPCRHVHSIMTLAVL